MLRIRRLRGEPGVLDELLPTIRESLTEASQGSSACCPQYDPTSEKPIQSVE